MKKQLLLVIQYTNTFHVLSEKDKSIATILNLAGLVVLFEFIFVPATIDGDIDEGDIL